jgi:hypothetical protein
MGTTSNLSALELKSLAILSCSGKTEQIGGRWLLSTLQSILVTDDDGNGLGVVGDSRPPKPHDGMWEVLASRVFVLGGGDQSRTRIEQDLPKAGCWAVLSAWVIMGIPRFRMRAPALVVWSFRVA